MNKITKITFLLLTLSLCTITSANEVTITPVNPVLSFLNMTAPEKLKQFINMVVTDHPRLLEERARLEVARANLRAADRALYNPELEIDSEKTNISTSSLQLSQTIDFGDKQGARTSVAQSDLVQAEAEFEIGKQALVFDLLSALADQHTSNEIYLLVKKNLELMKEFAMISEQRHSAGDVNLVELNLARLAYSETIMTYAQAAADASSSKETLRALLGKSIENIPEIPDSLPDAKLPADKEKFIQSLPAVRLERAKVTSAQKMVDLRQSEKSWDPTISIRGGKEDKENLTGITLSIPLNIRNSFSAEVEAAQQELIQTEYKALQFYREQRATVLIRTQRYDLLQQAWVEWRKNGKTSIQQQLKLIKRLWKIGDMNTTDYLVQLKQSIDTQTAGLELRGKLWESAFEWMNSTASIINWLNINLVDTSK